jgi:hypothetical protein
MMLIPKPDRPDTRLEEAVKKLAEQEWAKGNNPVIEGNTIEDLKVRDD